MENFTGNGWVILGLAVVIGWLLGLLTRSGGSKWKMAYNRERDAHLAVRRAYEDHLKTHGTANDARLAPYTDQRI